MSMSPPPLPPDPYAQYPSPGVPVSNPAASRAAVAVWVTASLLLLLSTCCVGSIAAMGLVPLDQIKQADETNSVPPEIWDGIAQVQSFLPVIAAVLALVTVVPAVVMLVLGFSVKAGKRGPTVAAMVLSIIALVGVGLLLMMSLASSVSTGQIDICGLSVFIGLGSGLVWCIVSLKKALAAAGPGYAAEPFAPMHQHPTPGSPGAPGAPGRSPDDDPWENSV